MPYFKNPLSDLSEILCGDREGPILSNTCNGFPKGLKKFEFLNFKICNFP